MKSSNCGKLKGAAALLLFTSSILIVSLGVGLAAPLAGKLRTRGRQPVIVNGNKVNAGIAIYSGSKIQSPENVGATVDLGVLGRLDLAPQTDITLTFSAGNVDVELRAGYVVLTTKKRVKGFVRMADGQVVKTDPAKLSSVIARTAGSVGPEVAAPIGAAGAAAGGIGAGTVAAGVGAAGAAVVGAAAVKSSGRGSDVSPSSPPQR